MESYVDALLDRLEVDLFGIYGEGWVYHVRPKKTGVTHGIFYILIIFWLHFFLHIFFIGNAVV